MSALEHLDRERRSHGLLTIEEVCSLTAGGNVIFDPFSVLISRQVEIGQGNLFYPCTSFICQTGSFLRVGSQNIFRSMFSAVAQGGNVSIGDRNEFGEGGVFLKANRPGSEILVGNDGRYLGGATVVGQTSLEDGSQVLGAINVDGCRLESGGSYRDPDPQRRAGLLKGQGTARGLIVPAGQVIAGQGTFQQSDLKLQALFHSRSPS